ncbi:PAS domain-containing hybrid sensor histidine kinase/response regulator [Paenibacillus agricola]|uniref:histidine kinase n=1 Tax=Paenibacillus agricola TaxID=2716264 RepID=A0ABX0JA36_9BACL|nr:PAS domain S-box protein [Paenibacillus agricola]NHN33017.1 PAS domain S-box protein [Paenibacillus agricola]
MAKAQVDHHSLFEHAYTFAPVGIALLSLEGAWIKVNPAVSHILGYSKEELLSYTYKEISHPEDVNIDEFKIQQLLEGAAISYETEKRYIQSNGNVIWASLHVSLVRDEIKGTPLYFIIHLIDITDKKATQHKLLEIEKIYKVISDNTGDVISFSNPEGILIYCSPSLFGLLGYRPEEIVGNSTFNFYHPGDLEELKKKSFSDNDNFTCRVMHKNGKYLWFETNFKIIRDNQGNIQKVVGIGRDVTKRKEHEDNLAEAQRIALLGSWELDIDHDHLIFSAEVYRIFNLSTAFIGNSPADFVKLIHNHDQQSLMDSFELAKNGQEINVELRYLQPEHSIKYFHLRGITAKDNNGKPIKINGTIQDVTERKNIELKLQESIERYTSLKKYNHDAIFSLDLEGNIINANVVAEQITGFPVDEMAGSNFLKFIGTGHFKHFKPDLAKEGNSEKMIDKIVNKDGQIIEVLTTNAPIIINGELVGYYIIAKDITDQKKLLIAKEAAEKTNLAKSEFLAMMSHEIRTPMNGVIGMTHLLVDTTELDAQQEEYVDIIRKSGNALLAIINDILDFSKIESGKTDLLEEPLDIRECVAETLDILSSKAAEKRLEMKYSVHANVPRALIGDAARLKQVLMNLIGNAIKFTYTGGVAITVEKDLQTPNLVQLKFIIKDTGIGIPDDKVKQLFQPFYQLEHFMTRKSEGTGLGLAISKKLVEKMGGNIWIEQTDVPGSTFIFTVALREEIPLPASMLSISSKEKKFAVRSLKILVAEDHEINQLVLRKMLEKLGHTVTIVENGHEAVQAVTFEAFDMIFMDVQMPELNGLDASRSLKASFPSGGCPIIIAVTANALKGDREKCLSAGMDDYISKPIKREVITEMITKYFPQ